jgi:hypothetical protein
MLALAVAGAMAAPIYGDINGNGAVDVADAMVLAGVAGGLAPNTDIIRRNGDVAPVNDYNGGSFGDGKINFLDALLVARKAAGISTAAWPAKASGYLLEAGNTFLIRKYNAAGTALTGPGTSSPDESNIVSGPISQTVGTTTYKNVFAVTASDGDVQHLVQVLDADNTPASVEAIQMVLGGSVTTFNPPLVVAHYPLQNGTTWGGTTAVKDVASGVQVNATYSASTQGPVTVTIADGVHSFDNAYKVTLTYSTGFLGPSGAEYYWFVPFLGPVQNGYTRTFLGTTTTVNPDIKLVSATLHGVLYP